MTGLFDIKVEHTTSNRNSVNEYATERYAIGYILQGKCRIMHDREWYEVDEQSVYLIEQGHNTIEHLTGCTGCFEELVIYFDGDIVKPCSHIDDAQSEHRFLRTVMCGIPTNLTIDQLAEQCFVSSSTFKRRFREHYNIAPHTWFMDRRLELAHQIITTTNLRIKNISTICGFVSFSHFVATFRQRYGITPARLRRSISRQKSIPLHIPEHK